MRIYAVAVFGLCLLLTGCPGDPDKDDKAMSMEESGKSGMATEMESSGNMEGMDHMDGEKKMEATTDQPDAQ